MAAFVMALFAATTHWTMGLEKPWPAPNVLPRPQHVSRVIFSLDGRWHFVTDPEAALTPQKLDGVTAARIIPVPSCWEAAFEDLTGYDGVAWYWRDFDLPLGFGRHGRRLFIRFDAVDYAAKVWLNGRYLGSHEGGYSPFEFEITRLVKPKGNRVVVRVVDPARNPSKSDGIALDAVPNGKQSHYCNIGGLWQSVHIISRAPTFIHSIFVAPESLSRLRVRVCVSGHPEGMVLRLTVVEPYSGVQVAGTEAPAAELVDATITLHRARLWSINHPALYLLQAELLRNGRQVSCAQTRFGVRTIEARKGRILLNGVPIFLAGALDQAFYPRGIYAPSSGAILERQAKIAKAAGLNFLRTHIKIPTPGYRGLGFDVPRDAASPTPGYLDVADEHGILIWDDFPSWYRWNEQVRRRVERQMYEWVWRDFNRPCIFCWCLINEEWGMNFDDPAVRRWIKQMWHRVKSWDPWRLVVDNSPAGHGHIISDIFDQHVYMAIPERARDWASWLDHFCGRPKSSFRYPESEERGFEPLMVSEFGNWGLPDVTKILAFYGGRDPYWFNQASYGGPIRAGLDAFERWGLRAAFRSLRGLAEATQRHQLDSLKYEIEQMRLRPSIVGYVITQFTDLNSESNGLMDMCRHPKLAAQELAPLQQQTVIVPDLMLRAFWAGESIRVPVAVSHFGRPLDEAKLRVFLSVDGRWQGSQPLVAGLSGDINVRLPMVQKPRLVRIQFELREGDRPLARNHLDVWAIPRSAGQTTFVRHARAGDKTVELAMTICGVAPDEDAPVRVLRRLTEADAQFIEAGGRALLIATDARAFGPVVSPLSIVHRSHKGRIGNWATAFCWLRPDRYFTLRLPYPGHLGMPFVNCMPMHVVDGVTPSQMADAWGGLFVAWMHDPAATILPVRVGKGVLVMTTFPLIRAIVSQADPVAQVLLADLIDATARLRPADLRAEPLSYHIASMVLVPTAREASPIWRYTISPPGPGWQRPDFDDNSWKKGPAGFGRPGTPGAIIGTKWLTSDIWLRKTVRTSSPASALILTAHHDEDAEVYINGVQVAAWRGYTVDYFQQQLDRRLLGVLKPGINVVAVHCHQTVGGQYIDVGIKAATAPKPSCPLPGGQIVIAAGSEGGDIWAYTTRTPPAEWAAPEFDDRTWLCGLSPFGHEPVPNVEPVTPWTTSDIWLRKAVVLDTRPRSAMLRIYHDEDAEVYVNGRRIFAGRGFLQNFRDVALGPQEISAFRPGRNVVAVHCHHTSGGQLIDVGLYVK